MRATVAFAFGACAVICMVVTVVSLATPVWLTNQSGVVTEGLFQSCYFSVCFTSSGKQHFCNDVGLEF